MMINKKSYNLNSVFFTNLIFAFFPFSFILGNLALNVNLLLLFCLGVFHLKKKVFQSLKNIFIKAILFFFIIIILSSALSLIKSFYFEELNENSFSRFLKSITFLRFFLMLIIIYLLSENNILNFKYFLYSSALLSLLIALDVIFQYIVGFNIFGYESYGHHNTSFFGNELIAGTYIRFFSFFSISFFVLFSNSKKNIGFVLPVLAICTLGSGIFLSGNRMSMILFLFGLSIFFILSDKLKKILVSSFLLLLIILGFLIDNDEQLKTNYQSYYGKLRHIFVSSTKNETIIGGFEFLDNYIYPDKKSDAVPKLLVKSTKKNEEEELEVPEPSRQAEEADLKNYKEQHKLEEYKEYAQNNYPDEWEEKVEQYIKLMEDSAVDEKENSLDNKLLIDDFESLWVYFDETNAHWKLFYTALDTWKLNKVLGNGIKSFREDCIKFKEFKENRMCSNHPHNFYLEILTETGIVGISTLLIIVFMLIAFIYKNISLFRGNNLGVYILLSSIISLVLVIFPIKSTGSFFSTGNATYLTLLASIIISYKKYITR